MWRPAATGAETATDRSSRTASSWISTQSAPSGITLPVNSRTQSPGPIRPSKGWPAGASPISRSRASRTASALRTA